MSTSVPVLFTKSTLTGIYALFIALCVISIFSLNIQAQTITFENPPYVLGNINGQDGWTKTGPYDHTVSSSLGTAGFGTQSLRISNAITSGSFGDMTFSRPVINEAGETSATNGGLSGGTRQGSYQVQFSLASAVPGGQQSGLLMSVAPDRGDGARMSYLRFEDLANGIHVFFDDYKDVAPFGAANGDDANGCGTGDGFTETDIATLDRSIGHTIKFVMVFVDGPRNDFVQIFIDGALTKVGTSWEDYYRFCAEQSFDNNTHTVDSLLFRTAGTAAPATNGNGFLIDNFIENSGPAPANTQVVNQTNINNWLFYDDETDKIDPTLGSFVTGPGATPLGTGSAQISANGTKRRNLATYQFSGTPLAAITTMKYSTYNPSAGNGGSANRSGYLTFNVDFNGSDIFQRRISFVPSVNGAVIQNTWQEWDTINGGNAQWLYSGANWPIGVGGGGEPGTTSKTWNQILTQYPNVRMRVTDSFVGIRVGEPYADGYTENIDAFKFGTAAGTTQFDFDPASSITATPATTPSAFDNDYTRINNAVQAIPAGGTVILNGTFNWTEANAAGSWSRGSDGQTGTAAFDNDNYCILPPANRNGVTITSSTVGGGTIQGPGDLPGVNLEGVFQYFNDGDNQNTTISNLRLIDFDLAIGMFNGAGGSDAYNNTHIVNNYILVARDLNATVAPADSNQNIGLHYSFGTNQLISGNTIDVHGDGVSAGANFSTEIGMQSNTSGGSVYNGLQITNNVVRVLNAQDNANPQVVLGIWENAHAHTSTITVSGNQFQNLAGGNNPAVNLERAFRVTSHSSGSSTVTYSNNTVAGANIGFQWISGSNFTGNQPVRLTSNTIVNGATGVKVDSNGNANLKFNRIVGNSAAGVENASGTVDAENNWWGCNYGPGAGGAGCTGTANGVIGTADANPWLTLTTLALPTTVGLGGTSSVASTLTVNSVSADTSGSGTVPNGIPVGFAGTRGTVAPSSSTTAAGGAGTTFTATAFGAGGVNTTVDQQVVTAAITVTASCSNVSTPTNITSVTGGTPSVPVTVDDVTGRGIFSTDMTLAYDPAVISSPVVTLGTVPSAGGPSLTVNTGTTGVIRISIFASQPFSGAGTLANISFTANGLPGTSSAIGYSAFKFNEGTPCTSTSNGLVSIISGTITGTVTYGNALAGPAPPRFVPNVTLNAAGSIPQSAATNGSGVYTLSGMGSGAYTVTPSKSGGVNSALSGLDSAQIAQFVVGLLPLNATQQTVADVSGTGGITSFDAALIARYVVSLPGSGSSGTWRFVPTSRSYPNVNTNQTGQDYTALLMGDVTGNWGDPGSFRMAASPTTKPVGITAGRSSASPNAEVLVPITVSDVSGKGVLAYQFDITYDPAVVEPALNPVDVAGTMSEGMAVTANSETPGLLKVVVFGANALNGTGTLLNLKFTAIGPVGSSSPLSWQEFMLNEGGALYTATSDGQIDVLAPNAQEASISGRLLTPFGQGVPNARITMTDSAGTARAITSNGFGYFQFGNVHVGETYTLSVESRMHIFRPVTVSVSAGVVNVDIIAEQ